jgi:hypothetical protein
VDWEQRVNERLDGLERRVRAGFYVLVLALFAVVGLLLVLAVA